jgi:hypothetical protein
MEAGSAGWRLTAGCVCFPSRWDLPSKLGRPLEAIHERVPGYADRLGRPTLRFFDAMRSGCVYRRGNWSLLDDPALFQPSEELRARAEAEIGPLEAGQSIWLRVESQTLQRLPRTGAVLFSIRVHRMTLAELAGDVAATNRLIGAIESMSPSLQSYKSLGVVREAAIDYLRARLESSGRPE